MKKVVLKLSTRSVPNKIEFAEIIVLQMMGNPHFKLPVPPLKDIVVANDALAKAYRKAQVGGVQDTEDMYDKEKILDQLLTAEANYVENIANQDPETAEAVILSAGMQVKSTGTINIPILSAQAGSTPGSVKLRRKAEGARVAYKWQYSADPFGDNTWENAGESILATFEIAGLQSVKRYWFRVAIVQGTGQGEFSDPITFVTS